MLIGFVSSGDGSAHLILTSSRETSGQAELGFYFRIVLLFSHYLSLHACI